VIIHTTLFKDNNKKTIINVYFSFTPQPDQTQLKIDPLSLLEIPTIPNDLQHLPVYFSPGTVICNQVLARQVRMWDRLDAAVPETRQRRCQISIFCFSGK
tara:strand:- start:136 stop:435 length:300 start_codon:yes stop_codon:yes gene_type:complete